MALIGSSKSDCLDSNNKPTTFTGAEIASFILAVLSVPVVLSFHLLPTVFAGLAVHVLTVKLASQLPARWGSMTHKFALAGLVVVVIMALSMTALGLWSFLHGNGGVASLLSAAAETLENVRRKLPSDVADFVPSTMEDLRDQLTNLLREHSKKISSIGFSGLATFVHVAFGMVIGAMTALMHFKSVDHWSPFVTALYSRTGMLAEAFYKVVFAQVKISALNTMLTAIYLIVALPFFDIHVPMIKVLLPLSFIAGLIPVIGNLISNTAIVLISLSISFGVALASLVFLVLIHKIEYFFNARIIGGEVQAGAWELLSAMLLMEAIFGIAGLVAAPVAYAWLKSELRAQNII